MVTKKELLEGARELSVSNLSRIFDPNLTASIETDVPAPSPGSPTRTPNRVTFVVPRWNTMLSLGEKGPPDRIPDVGITGRTEQHIHWHTTQGNGGTILSLGSSVTSPGVIEGVQKVPGQSRGYCLVTGGRSWHESERQSCVISDQGDVVVKTLSGKTAMLQADAGSVEIGAGQHVTIGGKGNVTIAGDPLLELDDVKYGEDIAQSMKTKVNTALAEAVVGALDIVQQAIVLGTSIAGAARKDPETGKRGWVTLNAHERLNTAAALANLGSSIVRWHASNFDPSVQGKVDIYADTYASLHGKVHTSVYGELNATLASAANSSVLGAIVGMSGAMTASVWSTFNSSLVSMLDVDIQAVGGAARISGGRVKISAPDKHIGAVDIQAHGDVQVASETRSVFVSSKKDVYIGGGGYGVETSTRGVTIAKVTSDESRFALRDFDPASQIRLAEKYIELAMGNATLTLKDGSMVADVGGNNVTIDPDHVSLDGDKIQLG